MNFIFLSPHFPPNYYPFAVRLKELGVNVLGLGDEPYDLLRPELKASLQEYYRVPDLHDYDQLVRAIGYFTHRYGRVDRIDSHSEYWLETEARLRTDFNISGIKLHEIEQIKRKSLMKETFKAAGVQVARGVIANTKEEAQKLIAEVGYPVVAKPDIGVGAAKTYKISNAQELEEYLRQKPPFDYFMEEFIEGVIQTYDGLTDREGNVIFSSSMQYNQGVMEIVNSDDDMYYYTLRDIPSDLENSGKNTARAFGVRERFFHFEYFRTTENRLIGLEVNIRPPGGLTTDMMNFANNIDVYSAWAHIIAGKMPILALDRPYHCCYIGRKQNKNYLYSHTQVIERFHPAIVYHGDISGIFSVALGNYGYLIRSPDLEEIVFMAEEIQKKI